MANSLQRSEPKLNALADYKWSALEQETFALTGAIDQDKTARKRFSEAIKSSKDVRSGAETPKAP